MQILACDLVSTIEAIEEQERETRYARLMLQSALISAGHDPEQVLTDPETGSAQTDDAPGSDGEEIFDLTDSQWVRPGEGDLDALDALLDGMGDQVSVSNADLPQPGEGQVTIPGGSDHEWL